jgi:hypothetical protein
VRRKALEANQYLSQQRRGNIPVTPQRAPMNQQQQGQQGPNNQRGGGAYPNPNQQNSQFPRPQQGHPYPPNPSPNTVRQNPPPGQSRGLKINPNAPSNQFNNTQQSYAGVGRGRGLPYPNPQQQPLSPTNAPKQPTFSPPTSPRAFTDANPKMRQQQLQQHQQEGGLPSQQTHSPRVAPSGRGQPLSPLSQQSTGNPFPPSSSSNNVNPNSSSLSQPQQQGSANNPSMTPQQPQFKQVQQQQQFRKTSPNVSLRSPEAELGGKPNNNAESNASVSNNFTIPESERPGSGPKPTLQKSQRYALLPAVSLDNPTESSSTTQQQPANPVPMPSLNFTHASANQSQKMAQNPLHQQTGQGHHSSPNPHANPHVNSGGGAGGMTGKQPQQTMQMLSTSPRGANNPSQQLMPLTLHQTNLSPRSLQQQLAHNNGNNLGGTNTPLSPRSQQQQQQQQQQPGKSLAKSTPNILTNKVISHTQVSNANQGQPLGQNPQQPPSTLQTNSQQQFNATPMNTNVRNMSVMQTTDKMANTNHQQPANNNVQTSLQQLSNNANQQQQNRAIPQSRPISNPNNNINPIQAGALNAGASSPLSKSAGHLNTATQARGRGVVVKPQVGGGNPNPNPTSNANGNPNSPNAIPHQMPFNSNLNPNMTNPNPNPNMMNPNANMTNPNPNANANLNKAERTVSPGRERPNTNNVVVSNSGTVGRGKGAMTPQPGGRPQSNPNIQQRPPNMQQPAQKVGNPNPAHNPNLVMMKPGGGNPNPNPNPNASAQFQQQHGHSNQQPQGQFQQRPPQGFVNANQQGKAMAQVGAVQQHQKVMAQQLQQQQQYLQPGVDAQGLSDPFEESGKVSRVCMFVCLFACLLACLFVWLLV